MKRLIGSIWSLSRQGLITLAFVIVITLVIFAFAQGVASLPLNFGEILTFMGIWLAIGVLLGQNKPPDMSLRQYLPRRITVYLCCYVFFIVIAMAYAGLRDDGGSDVIKGKEVFGLLVVSLLSFSAGFLAGQDKEREG